MHLKESNYSYEDAYHSIEKVKSRVTDSGFDDSYFDISGQSVGILSGAVGAAVYGPDIYNYGKSKAKQAVERLKEKGIKFKSRFKK